MISLQSKTTHESKSVPGVKFTVRTLNQTRRAKRELTILETRAKQADILRQYGPLMEIAEDARTPEQSLQMAVLDREYAYLRDSVVKPATVRSGLISIEGLEIDGAPATADSLLDSAGADYDELINEIHAACEAAGGLTAEQSKNSESDTTSSGQAVEADPTHSTATPAGN